MHLREAGNEALPCRVHDVVGVPLQQRHQRLGAAEGRSLLVGHQPLDPVPGARSRESLAHASAQAAGVGRQLLDRLGDQRGEVVAQPWVRLELERVRGFVERDESPEAVERYSQRGCAGGDVGLDEVEAPTRQRGCSQEADVVLPEHLARQESDQEPKLLVADGAVPRQRLARRLRAPGGLVEQHLHAREERAEGGEVEVDPFEAVDDGRCLERLRQRPTNFLLDRWLDRQQGLLVEGKRLGALTSAQRRGVRTQSAAGDAPHRLPIDQASAGPAHQLPLGHRRTHGHQAADQDAGTDPAGIARHAGQSRP